ITNEQGVELAAQHVSQDPAGNVVLTGASEALRSLLIQHFGDAYFQNFRRAESAKAAIFTRKVGHTQRGGRPILFDRFYAAQLGGKAVDMLLEGQNNALSILQRSRDKGFYVDSYDGNAFRDRWGTIHARFMHPSFNDIAVSLIPRQHDIQVLCEEDGATASLRPFPDLDLALHALVPGGAHLDRVCTSAAKDVACRLSGFGIAQDPRVERAQDLGHGP